MINEEEMMKNENVNNIVQRYYQEVNNRYNWY